MVALIVAAVLAAGCAALLAAPVPDQRWRLRGRRLGSPVSSASRRPGGGGSPAHGSPRGAGSPAPGSTGTLPGPAPLGGEGRTRRHQVLVAVLAGIAAWWLVGGPAGLVLGVALTVIVPVGLARLEPAGRREERVALIRGAPLLADLLAAALASGTPLERALPSVAAAVGGPTRERLQSVIAQIGLGQPADRAWAQVAELPGLGGIARTAARSARTGAPLAQLLSIAAEELRADAEAAALTQIRRAGIRAVLPLGLCLLPAFAILAVVPLVVGLLPAL